MLVPVTALYAGLLALVAIVLGFQVGAARLATGVALLHGDDMKLAEKIRRHANFTESVPLALLLMALIELDGASTSLLHVLGTSLLVARIAHPFGIHHDNLRHPARGLGSVLTTLVTLVAAVVAIWHFLSY